MAQPRIFFVPVVGPAQVQFVRSVTWRLVGGNNHDLGRAAHAHPDLVTARAAVDALRLRLDDAEPSVRPGERTGRWCWELHLDGEPVAVSSRSYERQRDCVANLGYFVAALPAARIVDELAVFPPRREIYHPDYRIEPAPPADAEPDIVAGLDSGIEPDAVAAASAEAS